jgi:hypothetical protein
MANILYPCIDCGILPSCYLFTDPDDLIVYEHYQCASCGIIYRGEVGFVFEAGAKKLWNEANHPDKFLASLNPCKEHPTSKLSCLKSTSFGGIDQYWAMQKNFIECKYNLTKQSLDNFHLGLIFDTPKEARDAWNELNQKSKGDNDED